MTRKPLNEFAPPMGAPTSPPQMDGPAPNSIDTADIDKDYKSIKTLLQLLEPRGSRDTEILSLLHRLNKSTFAKLKQLKGSAPVAPENNLQGPPQTPVAHDPNGAPRGLVNDSENPYELEETTSVGGGNIQGVAGGLRIESKDVRTFRHYIRGLLIELYSIDKGNFIEASKQLVTEMQQTRSTGMNYLGKFFLIARPAIEKEYLDLQTSQDQRDSMRDNLIKLYTEFIGQLVMNSSVADQSANFNASPGAPVANESIVLEDQSGSTDGIFFDDLGYKDPIKEREVQQKANKSKEVPDPHPGTEKTGASAASRVFTGTNKQLEEIFSSLGDKQDQEMFSQYLPKNVIALFELLATQQPLEGGNGGASGEAPPVTESLGQPTLRQSPEAPSQELAIKYAEHAIRKQGYHPLNLTFKEQTSEGYSVVEFMTNGTQKRLSMDIWWVKPGDYGYASGIPVQGKEDDSRLYGEW